MPEYAADTDVCSLAWQGVIKLIDAAKKAGVKKFVLQTSILTNGKAIGEGLNPIFLVLNAVTGALDKKLEVSAPFPDATKAEAQICPSGELYGCKISILWRGVTSSCSVIQMWVNKM